MILYSKRYSGLFILFRIRGTSWPRGVPPALLASFIGWCLGEFQSVDDVIGDKSQFMSHPYPFQLFCFIIGFLVVFRTNFAYQRYWEGRSVISQMASKWLDGACMSVVFDAPGDSTTPYLDGIRCRSREGKRVHKKLDDEHGSHSDFTEEILHLFSLMHALAMQHLRGDSDLDNLVGFNMFRALPDSEGTLRASVTARPDPPKHSDHIENLSRCPGWLSNEFHDVYKSQRFTIIGHLKPEERKALEKDGLGGKVPTEARVTMVESWIMRRLIARQKHCQGAMCKTSPPILSRLYQVISDGFVGFGHASKIADTPFPFPYQNLLQIFLWLYVSCVPIVMNAWLRHEGLRAFLTFLAVWCYFALHEVGNNLEDPYIPYDPNELALTHYHWSYNAKLLSFVPIPESQMEDDENSDKDSEDEQPAGHNGVHNGVHGETTCAKGVCDPFRRPLK